MTPGRTRSRFSSSLIPFMALLAASAILGLIPLLFPNNYFLLTVLILANIWAMLAISWDILAGYAGQISFGHSFFFGLGGYTAAILSVLAGWSPVLIIALGGIVASLGGLVIVAPALRLRGPYLSLMTLVAALALDKLMRILKLEIGIPGAEGAILCIPHCFLSYNSVVKYYVSLGLMMLLGGMLYALGRSRIGLVFEAIRDDEEAAQAAGFNTSKYKTLAFAISGFVAGVSGAFYVYHMGSASPSMLLDLERSVEAIATSVLGGMGTIIGPIGGAYFLVIMREYLRPLLAWRFFALFSLALLVLLFLPRGVLTELRLRARQWL